MSSTPKIAAVLLSLGLIPHAVSTASANQVTYQIDMAIQTAVDNFRPGTDEVLVAGNFNGWTMVSLTNLPGTSIYGNTFAQSLSPGQWENHKFIIDHAAGGQEWESIPDRFFEITAEDQVLPVVFFNDLTSLPETTPVTWSVNMTVQTELGEFEPFFDEVFVAGDMNGWDPYTSVLTPSGADTNIWTGTFDVENSVGATVNYKFVMLNASGEVWERDGLGPNGARNRQFIFTNEVTSLPVVFFSDEIVSTVVTQEIAFSVSLAAQIARGDIQSTSNVWVAGDMTEWAVVELTQHPTNALAWGGSLVVTGNLDGAVAYKFVYAGPSGEEVWEDDGVGGTPGPRQFTMTAESTQMLPAYFNDMEDVGPLSIRSDTGGQITLEWAGGPFIRLQTDPAISGTYLDVPGTVGISSTNLNPGSSAAHYRLTGP